MVNKEYDFTKILKEYNKEYKKSFRLNLKIDIDKATMIHSLGNGSFEVIYLSTDNCEHRYRLSDFVYKYVRPIFRPIDITNIKTFILRKEDCGLNLKIEILPPSKIRYAYLCNNYYAPGVGQLGKSCMRSKENQKALNFYIKNNVKIVVVMDDNHKIHARALLWDNVKSTRRVSTFTYLDRVYAKSSHLVSLFRELAEKNKWKYYDSMSAGNANRNYYKDNIDVTNICHFPYADTFRHLYYKDNIVSSGCVPSKVKHAEVQLHLTNMSDGGYIPALDPHRVREAISGNYVSKKDAIFVKRYDAWVLKKNIVDISGAYYSVFDDKIIGTGIDGYILKENSVTEIFTNNIIDKSNAIQSTKGKGYIHKINAVYLKDKVYHKLDSDIVRFNNKWYHISQCFINYNREKVNEELEKPTLTPKGNRISIKQPKFFDMDIPNNYMQSLTLIWYFTPPKCPLTREGSLIPKEHTIIAYNLVYNSMFDNIEYQEVYCTDKTNFVRLTTGELIINSTRNKQYLKKFNNKWYIKREFEAPNKNQLMLF